MITVPLGLLLRARLIVAWGMGSSPCGFIDMIRLLSARILAPPSVSLMFLHLSTCLDKIGQQSHQCETGQGQTMGDNGNGATDEGEQQEGIIHLKQVDRHAQYR